MLKCFISRCNAGFHFLAPSRPVLYFSSQTIPEVMQAWCTNHEHGTNGLVLLDDIKVQSDLKPTEVLVRVRATSLNPVDTLMRKGFGSVALNVMRRWNKVPESRLILGRDFSGVVVKRGKMVTRFKEGEQVWGTPAVWRPGTFSEYCCVSQDELAVKPHSLSHVEAASFPYVFCTVWSALCDTGRITERNARLKRVFIVAGSGGIGTTAIQLMKTWGAHVTSTCSEDAIDLLKSIGADDIIDYRNEDVTSRIRDEQSRFDVILDTVGGNIDHFTDSKSCNGSTYILLAPPLLDNIDRAGIFCGTLQSGVDFLSSAAFKRLSSNIKYRWAYFKPNAAALNSLNKMVTEGKVLPVIDSVFHYSELLKAFERLDSGHLRGKVVLNFETTS